MLLVILESKYIFKFDIIQYISQVLPYKPELLIEQQNINEQNNTMTFDIIVSTSQPINVVQADLRFDSNMFSVKDIQFDKSFTNIITRNEYSNSYGTINIIAGLPNPGFMGKGLLARVVLDRKQLGNLDIQLLSSSKVLANDGLGTNLLFNSTDTLIEIK
jgi:hypothetical protein